MDTKARRVVQLVPDILRTIRAIPAEDLFEVDAKICGDGQATLRLRRKDSVDLNGMRLSTKD